jgi:opacity protein-like surface antigen
MNRLVATALLLLALALPASASADPRQVKPDRAAVNRLLDEFVPDVVAQKDLKRGWDLVAGASRTVSRREWLRGNTSVQKYPAKGATFHGWLVNYSYRGDVGFDLLLQPTKPSLGAWSFRGEARRIHGRWRITTWYPVATFAPPGRTQTVLGPNDLGAANSAAAGAGASSRLGSWVLLVPVAGIGTVAVLALAFAGVRWARRRGRVREIRRSLAQTR